jgi:hypothetical protein
MPSTYLADIGDSAKELLIWQHTKTIGDIDTLVAAELLE